MPKRSSHIVELAKLGAEARLRELANEARNIIGLFPHLRDSFDEDELPVSFILAKAAGRPATRQAPRARRKMSTAAGRAVGERMKRQSAARRNATKE